MERRHILIIGSFFHPKNRQHYTSAAEQLAELFRKNHIPFVTTTRQYRKFLKLLSTLFAIIRHSNSFSIAVLPLYGTPMNFIWHQSAAVLLKLLGKKIIVVVHGGSIPEQISKGEKKFFKALNRADKIVCPSGFMAGFLKQYGYDAFVIENVLDIDSYPFQNKKIFRPHILWMRSFSGIYNPQMAVRVAVLLAKRFPSFKMVMAGSDHGLMDATRKMIEANKLQDKIVLPGYIDHAGKIAYAQEYDIYINTNTIDNAPVSVVENMALGLAIVSVNIGGIPYMVKDGVNGVLVEQDSHEQMADAVEHIINDAQMAIRFCSTARLSAEAYDEKYVIEKWRVLLEELEFSLPVLV